MATVSKKAPLEILEVERERRNKILDEATKALRAREDDERRRRLKYEQEIRVLQKTVHDKRAEIAKVHDAIARVQSEIPREYRVAIEASQAQERDLDQQIRHAKLRVVECRQEVEATKGAAGPGTTIRNAERDLVEAEARVAELVDLLEESKHRTDVAKGALDGWSETLETRAREELSALGLADA